MHTRLHGIRARSALGSVVRFGANQKSHNLALFRGTHIPNA